ncbi:hypothetical protein FSP39_015981 [Pinctada imbricata]|uniref:Uncharacterized protein n=1 Tax=Pinctada imbricata TaxID=66713 RepID=A0AA88XMK8_PINIB|nr:hypothetical protein FSP39_015981 [Pinctada imbricata]
MIHIPLSPVKEAWLVNSLVDYYYISHSEEALGILTEIREPHDRHLVEKISEGIKTVEHRLQAFRLLLYIACKQPIWLHKLLSAPVFPAIIKCLKTEADVPVLMTGVMVLTILLPSLPVHMGSHLQEMFDIFSYAVAFSVKKPGNVPEVFLIHLQVALYALFHRLYGMFPYNFLIFLRHFYSKKENFSSYQEFIKPMLERVRLHPHLIDATRESETSQKRWKQMENHDILVECAKMSLDILEGTWEELSCPISPKFKLQYSGQDKSLVSDKSSVDIPQALHSDQQDLSVFTQPIAAESNLLWSPSLLVGLSTPPPSQRTTPATSLLETSSNQHLFQGLSGTPQATPPVVTPAETPPITDDSDGKTKKTSKAASLRGSDNRKLSGSSHGEKLHLNIIPGSSDSNRSVPPSPLKVSFISEPPHGTLKSQPIKSAVRELQFDFPPSLAEQKIQFPQPKNPKEMTKAPDVDTGSLSSEPSTSYHISPESRKMTLTGGTANPPQVSDGAVTADKNTVPADDPRGIEQENDLMESFSMDTLPKVIEKINSDDEDTMDKEVSDLTQAEQPVYLTAESVQKFMRNVNRIRFNSMTASNNMLSHFRNERAFGGQGRSRSCPQLPKGTPEEEDDIEEEQVSRSASKPDFVHHSVGLNKIESLEKPEISQETKPTDDTASVLPTSSVTDGNTTGSTVTTCPVLKEQDVNTSKKEGRMPSGSGNSGILDLLRHFLMPANLSVCHDCKQQTKEEEDKSPAGPDSAMFSVLSPMELLDQYFRLGSQVHAKELSKIPMTSKDTVNWTHFGGMPPPDEINILRGQLFMMENQILYERNKREMHAKRNRRLLRRITHANALEEQNKAQFDQIQILSTEIKNLQVSLKLLQAENQSLKEKQESNENETRVTLSACLIEKEDLMSAKAELNTLLVRQREEQDKLQQVLQLHQELLLMGELQQKYQEKLNMLKLENQMRPEQELMMNTMRDENKGLRSKLDKYRAEAEARHSRIEELDETLKQKSSYQDDPDASNFGTSFPRGFGYGVEETEDAPPTPTEYKPRILLMGLRRSGKSSIQKVVFHKVSPNETLFLESTNKIVKEDVLDCSFIQYQIWDLPGQDHINIFDTSSFDTESIINGCSAIIFVIDAQDEYMDALAKLHTTVTKAYHINPNIKFEVFIHKVDGLSDDHKIETQRDIHQRATDNLADDGLETVHLSFNLTSIYDHSIFEAFSKVVQKLIPQLPILENLLNILISNSGLEKAFLFDVVSKIYLATDSSPVDMQSYELCCDMIDVVIDVSYIYGQRDDAAFDEKSRSTIKLNNGTILYLREVNKYLALVCILREDSFEKQGVIDYNFMCFQQAIQEVFEVKQKGQKSLAVTSSGDYSQTNGTIK